MPTPPVTLIDPTDERWTSALARVGHDVYATPGYVTAEALRIQAEPVGCLIDDGGRLFLLPLLLRSVEGDEGSTRDAISPYGYPGIVLDEDGAADDDFADDCLAACLDALRGVDVCTAFVRLHPVLNASLGPQLRRHPVTENGLTVSIDLTVPADQAWAAMSKGHANAINRANRAEFRVEISPASDQINEFAAVYAETLQRLGADETYHFSDESLGRLAALNEAFVAVAYAGDVVAGAYLCFESHGIVQMHLGGPRTEFRKPSPSHLMIHSIAQWARERENSIVHLGGGVGGTIDDSLFTFKAGFSHSRHPYRTLRLVANQDLYDGLISARARRLGSSSAELLGTGFFPAYRATPEPSD
ncbi:GNAT family N-acetyltransferase [Mycobacterium sp. URHB0044]|uniref:GNAT family N-acetyltransferase n=1 Tax=Mycobacterium sp. URHB0044 TaxID=1380386 RepID=UPI000685C978|nr:GNAT family N-acetyltransferase [Mycobacterium sp. URHB0044]